jgi:hypothetical protein
LHARSLNSNYNSIGLVNNTDSDSIRNIVVGAVASHKQDLLQKGPFQELVREVGDFAVDLVLRMAKGRN